LYDIGSWVLELSYEALYTHNDLRQLLLEAGKVSEQTPGACSIPPVAFMTHELQLPRATNKHKETAPTPRVRGY
jgi:hypothetical protein